MQFPIQIATKILTLAPKLIVTDASGAQLGFVRQRLFTLREKVTVFSDESQAKELYKISTQQIIDFSASYHIASASGREIGFIRRRGVRSLWRAHYEVYQGDQPIFEVQEENPWVRAADLLIGEIPFVGLLTGYFLNPTYNVSRRDGTVALRVVKGRSLLESRFTIEQVAPVSPAEQECVMLGLMMMILLERSRG